MRTVVGATLALVSLAATAWCLSAAAGMYSPPGGDGGGQWLSDSVIVFVGVDPQTGVYDGIRTVGIDASPPVERLIVPRTYGLSVSPDRRLLAFQREDGDRPLVVSAADGTQQRTVFDNYGQSVGWLEDSSRLVFRAPDYQGVLARLYSVRPDGRGLEEYPANVHGVPSPDGSLFAYEVDGNAPPRIRLVSADGTSAKTIATHSSDGDADPVWSPDGSRLAFWSFNGGRNLAIARIGGGLHIYDIEGTGTPTGIAWGADGRVVYAETALGLMRIDVARGTRQLIPGVPLGTFSPDGTRVAYSAGGECRDRLGIYVVNVGGTGARRVSNSCRVIGTNGPDILHGSFSQVVVGLAGNDTLYADDTYYFFDGDTLYGGPGNDALVGGFGQDILYGGQGDDTLSGGPSKDVLIGGPGHDHIDGGGGNDVIGAQDGERDWISCGTSGPGSGVHEHDIVYADRIDVVARDCEVVHRR